MTALGHRNLATSENTSIGQKTPGRPLPKKLRQWRSLDSGRLGDNVVPLQGGSL